MKLYLDASVLVAIFWEDDPHHAPSLSLFKLIAEKKYSAVTSKWSLLEVARGLVKNAVEEITVWDSLSEIITQIQLEPLEPHLNQTIEYILEPYRLYASDALHLKTALNQKTEKMVSLDEEHFHKSKIKKLINVVFPEELI